MITDKNLLYETLRKFDQLKALIIGDAMLDSYLWGEVSRISPEAPVPVVSVVRKENRPGGAANVAMNLKALGATPVLCALVGNDLAGNALTGLIDQLGMSTTGLVTSKSRITTVKTRIIGNNQQLVRSDEENDLQATRQEENQIIKMATGLIGRGNVDVVVFEDYDKGTITPSVIEQVQNLARKKNIPVAIDPKKRNFMNYHRVDLFKPNLREVRTGLNIDIDPSDIKSVRECVEGLRKHIDAKIIFLTLSKYGVFIMTDNYAEHIPAQVRHIADASGAGDTVISVAALCLALGTHPKVMAELANIAGGQVCEKVGVVPVSKERLMREVSLHFEF